MKASKRAARELRIYHRARFHAYAFSWEPHNFSLETPKAILRRWDERAEQAACVLAKLVGDRRALALIDLIEHEIEALNYAQGASAADPFDNWDELDDDSYDREEDWEEDESAGCDECGAAPGEPCASDCYTRSG